MIKVLQEFECYVDNIIEGEYFIVLKDITNPKFPDEGAVMDFIGFEPVRGEIFTYTIEQFDDGLTFNVIYFPKPKVWTKEEIEEIKKRAEELYACSN